VHAGWLLALLDSAPGCAVQTVQPGVCGLPRSICMSGSWQ
jgi:acyl-coenzyme A thioesterase PaaI-like protein